MMDKYAYGILILINKYKNLKGINIIILIQFALIMMELF